jgi:hypothetical protein
MWRIVLRLLSIPGLLAVMAFMSQVGPDDAVSNLYKWWAKVATPPDWIKAPGADLVWTICFAAAAIAVLSSYLLPYKRPPVSVPGGSGGLNISEWADHPNYSVWVAACLWINVKPSPQIDQSHPAYPMLQMIKGHLKAGTIKSLYGDTAMRATVSREELLKIARLRKEYPPFLFPEGPEFEAARVQFQAALRERAATNRATLQVTPEMARAMRIAKTIATDAEKMSDAYQRAEAELRRQEEGQARLGHVSHERPGVFPDDLTPLVDAARMLYEVARERKKLLATAAEKMSGNENGRMVSGTPEDILDYIATYIGGKGVQMYGARPPSEKLEIIPADESKGGAFESGALVLKARNVYADVCISKRDLYRLLAALEKSEI